MSKIAIMGSIHQDGLIFLKKQGYNVFEIMNFSENELKKSLNDVDGIVLRTAKLTKEVLENCNKLKIVSRHGVGYDNVDLNVLNNKKIALAITGSSNAVSVAEYVMAMFLNLCRLIKQSDQLVREAKFKQKASLPDFYEIYNKNILILGFGRIGKALAKRCLGFESNVLVYDPFIDKKIIEEKNCSTVELEDGIKKADFISIHLPYSKDTENMIDKKFFSIMKKNCIIVNAARGGIINENDLHWALSNNKIYGAAIDVYTKEPPDINNPLFNLNNIIFSPHNAALTLECRKRMALESCENIFNYLDNKSHLKKENIVNNKFINL